MYGQNLSACWLPALDIKMLAIISASSTSDSFLGERKWSGLKRPRYNRRAS